VPAATLPPVDIDGVDFVLDGQPDLHEVLAGPPCRHWSGSAPAIARCLSREDRSFAHRSGRDVQQTRDVRADVGQGPDVRVIA
jgi:hypothetical protein